MMRSHHLQHTAARGIGLVYQPGLEVLMDPQLIDFLEVEPQGLWSIAGGEGDAPGDIAVPAGVFELLGAITGGTRVHSVGLPVGGLRTAPPAEVAALRTSIAALGAGAVSEHLAWSHVVLDDGACRFAGFLFPPVQTAEGIAEAASRIRALSAALGRPVAIENPVSYLRPRPWELPDGAFLAAVAEAADCGILLDLHNAYANQENGRQRVCELLSQLPLERVVALHVAGGARHRGYWLDAHSGAAPAEVFAGAVALIGQLPGLEAVSMEVLAPYATPAVLAAVRQQLEGLHAAWRARRPRALSSGRRRPGRPAAGGAPSLRSWQRTLAALVGPGAADVGDDDPLRAELTADPGVGVLRELAWQARAGALSASLAATVQRLRHERMGPPLRTLLGDYFRHTPPSPFASQDARAFARYLERAPLSAPLAAALRTDLAAITAAQEIVTPR